VSDGAAVGTAPPGAAGRRIGAATRPATGTPPTAFGSPSLQVSSNRGRHSRLGERKQPYRSGMERGTSGMKRRSDAFFLRASRKRKWGSRGLAPLSRMKNNFDALRYNILNHSMFFL